MGFPLGNYGLQFNFSESQLWREGWARKP